MQKSNFEKWQLIDTFTITVLSIFIRMLFMWQENTKCSEQENLIKFSPTVPIVWIRNNIYKFSDLSIIKNKYSKFMLLRTFNTVISKEIYTKNFADCNLYTCPQTRDTGKIL